MKVLFREKVDNTLRCIEVCQIGYDPINDVLHLDNQSNVANIIGLGPEKAEQIVRDYFELDKLDLSSYFAFVDVDLEFPQKEE